MAGVTTRAEQASTSSSLATWARRRGLSLACALTASALAWNAFNAKGNEPTDRAETDAVDPIPDEFAEAGVCARCHVNAVIEWSISVHYEEEKSCQECHGPVERMEHVRREYGMKMSWCLDCHKQKLPEDDPALAEGGSTRGPIHCTVCHR